MFVISSLLLAHALGLCHQHIGYSRSLVVLSSSFRKSLLVVTSTMIISSTALRSDLNQSPLPFQYLFKGKGSFDPVLKPHQLHYHTALILTVQIKCCETTKLFVSLPQGIMVYRIKTYRMLSTNKNHSYSLSCISTTFWIKFLSIKIASVVPLPGVKPNCSCAV